MSQGPPRWGDEPTPMLVVTRFVVTEQEATGFRDRARRAVDVLTTQPGLVGAQLARATDDPTRWVLAMQWDSVGSYRRALSAFDVKVAAVPLLSEAVDEPTAFEVLDGRGDRVVTADSALAPDAASVRLGETSP
jgi:quinol monooxygenase YgiN